MNATAIPPVARLLGLATVVPPFRIAQDIAEEGARRLLAPRFPNFEHLANSFRQSGIEARYSVVPLDWFETPKDWAARNDAYLNGATVLFAEAAELALERAGWQGADVDTIVTVSSTGIATPTLEARAFARLGFRTDVARVPVFGLGCAGGVTGLSLAVRLALAQPGSKVLLVTVEACTLSFRSEGLRAADIIATILFGDGAAAACVSTAGDSAVALRPGVEHLWPDTLSIMGWHVDNDGLGVVFDRSIPPFATRYLAEAVAGGLNRLGLSFDNLSRFVCHPGGMKVVDAVEASLHLGQGALNHERGVLRDFGNMSAPTVLFVLERVLRAGNGGKLLLLALGPGFTASMLPVSVAA